MINIFVFHSSHVHFAVLERRLFAIFRIYLLYNQRMNDVYMCMFVRAFRCANGVHVLKKNECVGACVFIYNHECLD